MKYRRDYQETHDIDWFFRYKGKVYHAASNGGMLPDKVDSYKNRIIQEKLEDVMGEYDVQLSEHISDRMNEDLSSFQKYAVMGFVSLDRCENADKEQYYQRIAFPANNKSLNGEELIMLMPVLNDNEIEIEE